ncbi:unnamed protein product [Diatraea saccharalis]|uniref:F-box domain-containing protein n=1 Tax=Diatraea saccharalis TaxID=40085 RepID=A0A9N9R4M1_9NEOP|nr:unnamed protein product [Diatraea saccharalis]
MIGIECLPLETFVEILKKTDGITVGRCRRVCKSWKEFIDSTDLLWYEICRNEFRYSSKIAKKKSGNECSWYHIYRNLKLWENVTSYDRDIREFYKFSLHDKSHALEIDYSILPLKDQRGIVLYDIQTLKYIPVAVPEKNCLKIANNNYVTVLLLKTGLLIQRTVENRAFMSEAFFKADDFILTSDILYFYNNRQVFKCDLAEQNLSPKLMIASEYDIKTIQLDNKILNIFTDCGKIVNIKRDGSVEVKSINCPVEWIKQIKYICPINDRNFVCYSRNLFKIETDKYQHLYLDFPPITALFFYADIVLIGTKEGEILLYRLSSQKRATKPIFETLAKLPEGKFTVQLDVCETKSGPLVVASTFFEIYLVVINFFPHENTVKVSYPKNKLMMYKRFLRLRDRLRSS